MPAMKSAETAYGSAMIAKAIPGSIPPITQPPTSAPITNAPLSIPFHTAFAAAICCGERARWGSNAAWAGRYIVPTVVLAAAKTTTVHSGRPASAAAAMPIANRARRAADPSSTSRRAYRSASMLVTGVSNAAGSILASDTRPTAVTPPSL